MNLNYLLIFIPIAVGLSWFGASPLLVFATAALTIVPLSKIVGSSTETLGTYLGPAHPYSRVVINGCKLIKSAVSATEAICSFLFWKSLPSVRFILDTPDFPV
jgi:hypothetical protein